MPAVYFLQGVFRRTRHCVAGVYLWEVSGWFGKPKKRQEGEGVRYAELC